jgi:chemotaxis protein MotB
MFWAGRLKQAEDTDSSWVLSYGDLVTLLLAVFVMIAAMSEVKPGAFGKVTGGMRQAFGFAAMRPKPAQPQLRRPPTLLERIEQAGFTRQSQVQLTGPDDEVLATCDVLLENADAILRIAGHACFARGSTTLELTAEKAVRRLSELLADGNNRIEVRGYAGDGEAASSGLTRDALDLSYARGRAAAAILMRHGVSRDRLYLTACGSSEIATVAADARSNRSAGSQPSRDMPEGADRRIEIVVHAVLAAGHAQ